MNSQRPRLALLGQQAGWHAERLLQAATHRQIELTYIPMSRLVAQISNSQVAFRAEWQPLQDFAGVLVRGIPPGSVEQLFFRMNWLYRLAAAGVVVINPASAIERCVDKYHATALCAAAGLRVPRTVVCETADDALAAWEWLDGDVVLKSIYGSEGRGMMRLQTRPLAERALRLLERLHALLYLQQYIANPGWDARLLVIGGEVVAAIRRTVPAGDFRANVAIGAAADPWQPPADWCQMAIQAAAAVGAEIVGVDLLPDLAEIPYLIEVNSTPGFRALEAATGLDVAGAMIDYLAARAHVGVPEIY